MIFAPHPLIRSRWRPIKLPALWNPDGVVLIDAHLADPGLAIARLDPEDRDRTNETLRAAVLE